MGLLDRVARTERIADAAARSGRGLLSKASSFMGEGVDADEAFEEAFVQRLRRLPTMDSTPYTALSLLKAFHPFSAGLCLVLRDGFYECVASIGVESEAASIPARTLFPQGSDSPRIIGAAGDFGIASAATEAAAWVFPVSPAEPPYESAMILVEEPGRPLTVPVLARVISACADNFAYRPPRPGAPSEGLVHTLRTALARSSCQLIVLERGDSDDLAKEAAAAVSALGSAIALDVGKTLIVVPSGRDRELLAHRLAKSLGAKAVAGTEVSSLDAAQEFLKAHM